jgi:phage/plasmid-associated DNA primase
MTLLSGKNGVKIMTDQKLIRQLQTAISLLVDVNRELQQRQVKVVVSSNGRLAKAPSEKNDPLEFYVNCCAMKQNAEITAAELFYAYKNWCLSNGSLSRGRRPFLDAIAQLGAPDGITGVIRGKSYTFKNLALKTK